MMNRIPANICRQFRRMASNGGDLSPAKKPRLINDDKSKRFVWVDLEVCVYTW